MSAVQARDSSTRPLSGTATVLCSVLDDNDNSPEFMQSSFQISIPENLPPGVVHTAQASDPDHGENGTIDYSIIGTVCGSELWPSDLLVLGKKEIMEDSTIYEQRCEKLDSLFFR